MKILALFIIFLMLVLARNSAVSLLLYSFFAADRDGYVFLEIFSKYSQNYKLITRLIFISIYLYSIGYLFLKIKHLKKIEFIKLFAILISSFLIVSVNLLKGDGWIWSVSSLVFSGIPAYFIWYVFSIRKDNTNNLIFYIFLKTLIATVVLLIPSLLFLDGSFYKAEEGIHVLDTTELNLSIPGAESIKGAYSRYSIYHNPNSLGFHSVIAFVFGFYLIYSKKAFIKLLGIILIICGCIGWLNSLTRGPVIFYLLGLLYLYVIKSVVGSKRDLELKLMVLLGSCIMALSLFFTLGLSDYLLPSEGDISVTARLDGYLFSLEAIRNNFSFGVGKDFDWQGYYPHFLPLALISEYGFITGTLISSIFIVGNIYTLYFLTKSYVNNTSNRAEASLGILFVFIVMGIALTNNFTSPIIFWILLAQADLIGRKRITN